MKRLLLALLLFGGLAAPASAACTVNTVPQVGVICDLARNPTYSASSIALVPASSATDIFCIAPGSSKTVSIRRVSIGGTAGTAINTPFLLYKRSTPDTGGTAATSLAAPVAVPNNPNDPASTATVIAYTANPTVASSPLLMDGFNVSLGVTTTAVSPGVTTSYYGTTTDDFDKGIDLPANSGVQLCVNLNGVSVSSGVLDLHMEWTEQ